MTTCTNLTIMQTLNTVNEQILSNLKDFELFSVLTEAEMKDLAVMSRIRTVSKHRFVFNQGDKSDYLYFLIQGTIKFGIHSVDDKEVIKSILHPRALFGEQAILGDYERDNFAKAMDEVIYIEIKVADFKQIMRRNFDLNLNVIDLLGKKIRLAEKRLESLVLQDARTRIIEFIKENAKNFGPQVGYEMLLKHSLTQQDIANFTGTSRQTVTSVLNDLKKSNQIYFKRKSILIRDMASLS